MLQSTCCLQVEFSSLDFLLHTKALLSTITYLSSIVPSQLGAARDTDSRKQVEKTGHGRIGESLHPSLVSQRDRKSHLCVLSAASRDQDDIINFRLLAMLGCFHVEVCDDRRSIADIRVTGMHTWTGSDIPVTCPGSLNPDL